MRRREFIRLVGGAAAAWPLTARAQQPTKPVVGFLSSQSPDTYAPFPEAFRQGLKEQGFVDGENVTIEYRWAHRQPELISGMAADLVHLNVDVIAATGGVAVALAAKAATALIPIVFNSGEDPVQAGLVPNLNRPGGNITGVSWFSDEVGMKRLGMMHQLVPAASVIAVLANPNEPETAPNVAATEAAARALGLKLIVLNATTVAGIETAFAEIAKQKVGAMMIGPGAFFINQRAQNVALAERYAIPCMHSDRASVPIGGLIAYGNVLTDGYRRNGVYVGRILKGDKPGDLPIDRATKFELLINLKTAKALGLDVPPTLLALADEVVE
jgi:putative tryptophan/tyrosine transport system substrate-binding protein